MMASMLLLKRKQRFRSIGEFSDSGLNDEVQPEVK